MNKKIEIADMLMEKIAFETMDFIIPAYKMQ